MNKTFARYATTSFVLLVFSLNTLLGFACGAGWNLGYNAGHHQHQTLAEQHSGSKDVMHHHSDNGAHEKSDHNKEKNEDCCTENVLTISLADKTMPKSVEKINPVCISVFTIAGPYVFTSPGLYDAKNSLSYLISGHPPPVTDIRIAIQRFQI